MDKTQLKYQVSSYVVIGKLRFFDYKKNHFGFIADVRTNDGTIEGEIFVPQAAISQEYHIQDGQTVVFELHKGKRGYYASSVSNLEHISIRDIIHLGTNVTFSELNEIVQASPNFDTWSNEEQQYVIDRCIVEKSKTAWSVLLSLKTENGIQEFIRAVAPTKSELEIMELIRYDYEERLLKYLIEHWTSDNKAVIKELFSYISHLKLSSKIQFKQPIIDAIVLHNNWTYKEISLIYRVLPSADIFAVVVNSFSFMDSNFLLELNSIINDEHFSASHHEVIGETFRVESENLSARHVMIVFRDFNNLCLIVTTRASGVSHFLG